MKYLLTIYAVVTTLSAGAQNLKVALEKNIIFFKLSNYTRHQQPFDTNGYPTHICCVEYEGFMTLIPDPGMRITLDEIQTSLRYPDTSYTLHAYKRDMWEYKDSIRQLTRLQGCDDCYIPASSHLYLLGYSSTKSPRIKFISGQMMKDDIWDDFKAGGYTTENLIAYIRLKCFNYDVDTIKFDKKKDSLYYFSGKVKVKEGPYTFVFDSDHPALVRV